MILIMKQTLVIGSTVVDVYLSVPDLPRRGSDINISAAEYRVGGCAYNVFKTLGVFKIPAVLCSPVGSGLYGRMVSEQLKAEGINPFVVLERENGCCYCLIEPDGERSFLSHHGAEYLFSRSWMRDIDFSITGDVFICGLEVEESTGNEIVEFVYEHSELEIYFAPGPRFEHIPADRLERLLRRRDMRGKGPLIHLNEEEAARFSGKSGVREAAEFIARKTENSVVVTLGKNGCYCLEKAGNEGQFVAGLPARVVNTVGAGDAHFGAFIACLKNGLDLETACAEANKTGAAIVSGLAGRVG